MPKLLKETSFICLDCEATGLDPKNDRIIEIGCALFSFANGIEKQFESLINPQCPIPNESFQIHNISDAMVQESPTIDQILPELLQFIGSYPIVGHAIGFDLSLIQEEARRTKVPCSLDKNLSFDTLRLARLYGESPSNSLQVLRNHFGIEEEGAHRAMGDVLVNIQVFQKLACHFKTVESVQKALNKPIAMKTMPLGKYKGRSFSELPLPFLQWASKQKFDEDLLFSIRSELNKRKKKRNFQHSHNPFSIL